MIILAAAAVISTAGELTLPAAPAGGIYALGAVKQMDHDDYGDDFSTLLCYGAGIAASRGPFGMVFDFERAEKTVQKDGVRTRLAVSEFQAGARLGVGRPAHVYAEGGATLAVARSAVTFGGDTVTADWSAIGWFGGLGAEVTQPGSPYLSFGVRASQAADGRLELGGIHIYFTVGAPISPKP